LTKILVKTNTENIILKISGIIIYGPFKQCCVYVAATLNGITKNKTLLNYSAGLYSTFSGQPSQPYLSGIVYHHDNRKNCHLNNPINSTSQTKHQFACLTPSFY